MADDTRRGAARRGRVAVLGLDTFSRKNRPQLEGLNARGFVYDVFAADTLGDSRETVPLGNTFARMAPSAAGRLRQLVRYFRSHRGAVHHAEVYPGGRFAALYVGVAKAFGVPVMVVERGDLLFMRRYGRATALSMRAAYRLADVVWYRELYQRAGLEALGVRRLFFLANAVTVRRRTDGAALRDIDFVWVNRLIAERKSAWFVNALARPAYAGTRNAMLGFLGERVVVQGTLQNERYVRERALPNLELHEFTDPAPVLGRSRFFVLPSDIVFCNNALLEAMAAGVVPLVSDVEGARLIVDHGINGFVFDHTEAGLCAAMDRALRLPAAEYDRMSRAAAEKVRTHFDVNRWFDALAAEYRRIGGSAAGGAAAGRPEALPSPAANGGDRARA